MCQISQLHLKCSSPMCSVADVALCVGVGVYFCVLRLQLFHACTYTCVVCKHEVKILPRRFVSGLDHLYFSVF